MMNNTRMVLEIWEVFRDQIGDKVKPDVLHKFLHVLEDYGIYADDIRGEVHGEDKWLDDALSGMIEEDDEDIEDEDV